MSKGFIPIRRTLFDHFLFKEKRIFSRFEAWLDLIQLASFKNENSDIVAGKLVTKDRGEIVASLRYLSTRWNWSMHKVCDYLELLRSQDMLIVSKESGISKIMLINFKKHNAVSVIDDRKNDQISSPETRVGTESKLLVKKNTEKGNTKRDSKMDAKSANGIEFPNKKGTPKGTAKGTLRGQRGDSEGTNYNKDNKEKKDNEGPTQDFLKREKEFYNSIAGYISDYSKQMLREFYDYWREPNKSKTKMRFEMQETWELKLRLIKWEGNQAKFNKGVKTEYIPKNNVNERLKSAFKNGSN